MFNKSSPVVFYQMLEDLLVKKVKSRSVFYQLLNPASSNLFSAAIGQSGAITGDSLCLSMFFAFFVVFVQVGLFDSDVNRDSCSI